MIRISNGLRALNKINKVLVGGGYLNLRPEGGGRGGNSKQRKSLCKRPWLGRSLCGGTEQGLVLLRVSPGVSGREGLRAGQINGGLTSHHKRFGLDSGREGKLPAGGRLQFRGYVCQASKCRN